MPTYLSPGVYVEEIPSGSKPIEGVSTSTAAFVGRAIKGPAGAAVLIGSLDDYKTHFGDIASESDAMGLAVQAFYTNGGKSAYICRLAGSGSSAASATLLGANGGTVFTIAAKNEGDWGNSVYFRVAKPDADAMTFTLEIGHLEDGAFVADERFSGLSMREDDDLYALTTVNDSSAYVTLSLGPAATVGDGAEDFQPATLTGGSCPDTVDYFSAGITSAMSLAININGLGSKSITLNPATFTTPLAGADHDADGASVAFEIQTAVRALGTAAHYASFTCTHDGPSNRFVLSTPENGSAASIEITTGTLAKLLRLDSSAKAQLTGTVLDDTIATLFSGGLSGIATLVINIDGHGATTLELDVAAMGLAGDHEADGDAVALSIQNAVRALNPSIPAYKDFTCAYDSNHQFVLTSGSGSAQASNLLVTGGSASTLLGLDAATTVVGRSVQQGTRNVVPRATTEAPLAGGLYNDPTSNDFFDFYGNVLRKVRDVSIIVVPGESWAADGSGNAILSTTLAHCEAMRSRVLIIDPEEGTLLDQAATVDGMSLPTSTYSVLYYPWVKVANPFHEVDPTRPKTLTIAPSAFAAGMWAKIDNKRGVWKAPAGVETSLLGVAGLQYVVENTEQDQLNPLGVNCLRAIPSFGNVIWGSRTLSTKANPEWRYVPVRRTAIMIELSIYNGIQWAVFEPNDYPLWGALRANIGGFMNGLFRAGAFQGATAKQAYFVRCGLGDTMTQADIDRGQVIVIVGFAPLKPAEFVIVRIQQKVGEQ